jgi:hypothetical protein
MSSWHHARMLGCRVWGFCFAFCCAASVAGGAAVEPRLSALAEVGPVDVVVGLRSPPAGAFASLAAIGDRQAAVLSELPAADVELRHRYESVPGFSARVTANGLRALATHPDVAWVTADLPGRGALDLSVPRIRADRVHDRYVVGRRVVVAVIDSGVERDHPDFGAALVHEECFCRGACDGEGILCRADCCPDGSARASGPGSAAAGHPHGTHVTGIVMSRGAVAGVGVAPAAELVAIRVLDENNIGFVSDWLAALDWIAVHRPEVRVVNMSLASLRVFTGDCVDRCDTDCRPEDGCDPEAVCGINEMFADVVARLRRRGTVVVAASGNNSDPQAMSTPACVPGVLAVGALDSNDRVAFFSNAGSELDILAPGVDVISSGLNGGLSLFCSTIDGQRVCGGTSMAAPHVAGTAALLAAARPGASAAQIEQAMTQTGVPVRDTRNHRLYPRLDARAAFGEITRTLEIDPGGGSGNADCLLAWNFFPPDIVRRSRRPIATCSDGDSLCDGDSVAGQCTFLLSLCFNVRDPLLPFCSTAEPIVAIDLKQPSPGAPPGSLERRNADSLKAALPSTPLAARDLCTELIPIVVRRSGPLGAGSLRIGARTASRNDSDSFHLRCIAP